MTDTVLSRFFGVEPTHGICLEFWRLWLEQVVWLHGVGAGGWVGKARAAHKGGLPGLCRASSGGQVHLSNKGPRPEWGGLVLAFQVKIMSNR